MNINEYGAIVAEWQKIYGVPKYGAFRYDPTQVRTCCAKCGHHRHRMARHHKANDFFFALNFPHLYAKRYIEFRKEDVDKLCDACHKSFHRYIKPLVQEMYQEFHDLKSTILDLNQWIAWCERWKARFLARYNHWVKLKPKIRKKKRKRRKQRRIKNGTDS